MGEVSGLDWYCGGEKFSFLDLDEEAHRLSLCFLEVFLLPGWDYVVFIFCLLYFFLSLKWYRNFNGTTIEKQTLSAQTFIFLKSAALLFIAFSWVWFRIGPSFVKFYPLRHTIGDMTRLTSWFMVLTVTYLEWSRSREHHWLMRSMFVISAALYSYHFVVIYQLSVENHWSTTLMTTDEMFSQIQYINETKTNFHEFSFQGYLITLACHLFLALFALIGAVPRFRHYFEANNEHSTLYNVREDEGEDSARSALGLLAKQVLRLETAPWIAVGFVVSCARGYVLQLLFEYFGKVYASTAQQDGTVLLDAVLQLTGVFMAYAFAGGLGNYLWGIASEKVVNGEGGLRNTLFRMMMLQELAYHDLIGSGKILTRFSTDTELVKDTFQIFFPLLCEASAAIIWGLIYLFNTSWEITFYMLSILPLTHAISYYQSEFFIIYEEQSQNFLSRVGEVVQDVFSKFHTVLIYGKKNTELSSFREIVFKIYEIQRKKALLRGLFLILTETLANATSMLALFLGIILLDRDNEKAYENFVTYCLFSINIVKGIVMILKMFPRVVSMVGAMTSVLNMIQREPQPPEKPNSQFVREFQPRSGVIEFKNVRFKYPVRRGDRDEEALRGISFKVKPNSKVAIVGGSGAGKSTIFQLLARFYDPTEGQVLIDGQDLKHCTTQSIRRHLGMVSQAHDLFAASLLENILYGTVEKRDDFFETNDPSQVRKCILDIVAELGAGRLPTTLLLDPVMDAVEKANATDFIDSPFALSRQLGEAGKGLSGGQKQRMTIARALFKSPKILLLDEVTSALDPISEKVIQEALDKLTENRTVLIVAHRLHTIKNADLILVMSKGKIIAQGTHNDLMKSCRKYSRMVNASNNGETLNVDNEKEVVIPDRLISAARTIYSKLQRDETLFKKYGPRLEEFLPRGVDISDMETSTAGGGGTTFSLSSYSADVFSMRPLTTHHSSDDETESESQSEAALLQKPPLVPLNIQESSGSSGSSEDL